MTGRDRDVLILAHMPLVRREARFIVILGSYNRSQVYEDLVGEGMLALVMAADRYDPMKGAKFSTFIRRRVPGAMRDYLRRVDDMPARVRKHLQRTGEILPMVMPTRGVPKTEMYNRLLYRRRHPVPEQVWSIGALRKGMVMAGCV